MLPDEVPSQLNTLMPAKIQRVVLHSLFEESQQIVQDLLVVLACPLDRKVARSSGVAVILDWLWAEASTPRAVRHGSRYKVFRLDAKQPSYKVYHPKHECAHILRYVVEI